MPVGLHGWHVLHTNARAGWFSTKTVNFRRTLILGDLDAPPHRITFEISDVLSWHFSSTAVMGTVVLRNNDDSVDSKRVLFPWCHDMCWITTHKHTQSQYAKKWTIMRGCMQTDSDTITWAKVCVRTAQSTLYRGRLYWKSSPSQRDSTATVVFVLVERICIGTQTLQVSCPVAHNIANGTENMSAISSREKVIQFKHRERGSLQEWQILLQHLTPSHKTYGYTRPSHQSYRTCLESAAAAASLPNARSSPLISNLEVCAGQTGALAYKIGAWDNVQTDPWYRQATPLTTIPFGRGGRQGKWGQSEFGQYLLEFFCQEFH